MDFSTQFPSFEIDVIGPDSWPHDWIQNIPVSDRIHQ